MLYHDDCPVCGNRKEWANDFLPLGITIHSKVLWRRNVVSRENAGRWLIEIVSFNEGEPVAHATKWGDSTCYIWDLSEVELLLGDLPDGYNNDGYEVDA